MATQAFRLTMTAPLHVGEAGVGLEETLSYLPSDTLFSALVVTWLEMKQYADWVDRLALDFAVAPPLLLTSAMPYAGDVRFFPKPLLPLPPKEEVKNKCFSGRSSGKRFKKVRWVSEAIFKQLIQGISVADFDALWQSASFVQGDAVWVTDAERAHIAVALDKPATSELTCWRIDQAPRVTIDRIRESSALFHIGRTHFARNCGLWCVARGADKWVAAVEDALHLLADGGVGGLRSRGHGAFKLDPKSTWPGLPTGGGAHQVLLSRLAPTSAQVSYLKAPGTSYELVTVGGWANRAGDEPLIRLRLRMLAEGSVIQHSDQALGALVDVNPQEKTGESQKTPPPQVDHPIYRNGYGFSVNLTLHKTMLGGEEAS